MYKEKASGELAKSQGSAGWEHQGEEATKTKFLLGTRYCIEVTQIIPIHQAKFIIEKCDLGKQTQGL